MINLNEQTWKQDKATIMKPKTNLEYINPTGILFNNCLIFIFMPAGYLRRYPIIGPNVLRNNNSVNPSFTKLSSSPTSLNPNSL